jgi:hypothetical protein
LALIVNLQERVAACFELLKGIPGANDAKEIIGWCLDVLTSGDREGFQLLPEYTNEQLARVHLFLERARLSHG